MPETTLILLKPDCVSKKLAGEVIKRLEAAGYSIRGAKVLSLDAALLREHYSHIADKPFFPEVENFMSSGPVIALAIAGDNVIEGVRELLGPTDSKKAAPGPSVETSASMSWSMSSMLPTPRKMPRSS